MSEQKKGIELVKLTDEEYKIEKEKEKQAKTAYFKREDVQKERKIKKAIFINVIIFALAMACLIIIASGKLPVKFGIILMIILCVASTFVSRSITKK